jgi:ATP-dependent RNA helicase RhlE
MGFSMFNPPAELLRGVTDLGFTRPTPIQDQAIPPASAGKDLLACAATGSGKTAAFLLPIIQKLMDKPRGTTRALIMTPTRELAAQIHQHLQELAVHTRVTGAAVYGGVGMGPQEQAFRKGVDILIATPGRLLDHMRQPYARLDSLELLVLDEADRMLDMGFLPDIRRVLKQIPAKRQTLFFSATMPAPIVKLSQEMLHQPATINLERKSAPAIGITQAVYPVPQELKSTLFVELMRRDEIRNAIVFLRTKHRTNRLFDQLERAGISVARIHGNRSQAQRTEALAGFKSGKYRILVATDIVARGIDVEALEHVVNFDVPAAPEDYIHRVGRTARAEAIGDAFTFVSPDEESDLRAIEKAIGRSIPRVVVPDFDYRQRSGERFEVPIAERIAAIRARKSEERAHARAKQERANLSGAKDAPRSSGSSNSRSSTGAAKPAAPAGNRSRGGRGRGAGGGTPRQG